MTGVIVKFMPHYGYGFVQGEDYKEYFFHISMLPRLPRIGEKIKFEPSERAEKGPRCRIIEFMEQLQ